METILITPKDRKIEAVERYNQRHIIIECFDKLTGTIFNIRTDGNSRVGALIYIGDECDYLINVKYYGDVYVNYRIRSSEQSSSQIKTYYRAVFASAKKVRETRDMYPEHFI